MYAIRSYYVIPEQIHLLTEFAVKEMYSNMNGVLLISMPFGALERQALGIT